jgi:putative membrane protein
VQITDEFSLLRLGRTKSFRVEAEDAMLHRRTVLVALAASAGVPAVAESQSNKNSRTSDPTSAYIEQTTAIGALSLLMSRVAQQRTQLPKLREFSLFEVAEQETVADVMKTLQTSGIVNGKVTPISDTDAEQHLDAAGREAFQKLRAEQQGPTFDRLYLQGQTEGHQKLLRLQESYLDAGRNRDALNVAKLAKGMIKEHLQLLSDITAEIGTTGAAPR